jgi:quercetin dioxygenase-like cupin family protein
MKGGMSYMIKISNFKDMTDIKNPHGVSARTLHDSEHALVIHINLLPGEKLKKHITPVDVIFYILEGKGIVEIGDERMKVSTDMLIESPAQIPHRLINDSDAPFRFLVIKTPKPTTETKLL